jgi:uncharacterized protein (DUF779 family)
MTAQIVNISSEEDADHGCVVVHLSGTRTDGSTWVGEMCLPREAVGPIRRELEQWEENR